MPTTKKRYYRFLLVGILVLAIGGLWDYHFHHQNADLVLVELKPINSSYGWGYEILAKGKPYIRQEFIPAIPGKHGFKTSEDALKVGRKVISKISARQLPPTITVDELKEMGIVPDSLPGQ